MRLADGLEQLIDHRGKTPSKLGAAFVNVGVPVVSAIMVKDGLINFSKCRFVSPELASKWMAVPTRRGDVLMTSEAPLGRLARVSTDEPLVLGQRIFALRGRQGILHSGFLYFALQNPSMQNQLSGLGTGTTVMGIRQSALRELKLTVPDFEDQRAIATVLGALNDKISANLNLITTADSLAEGVVEAHILAGKYVSLSEIADVTMGSSPPGSSYNEFGDGLAFYQGVRDFGIRTPSERVWTNRGVRFAQAGDTLISVRAPVGRVNLASSRCCIGRGLAAVRSTREKPATLFHLAKLANWAPFEAEGTVFGSINQQQLRGISVPAVADSDQVEPKVASLENLIASHLKENELLAELRDTLLPALMSGQMRVYEAERRVEDVV